MKETARVKERALVTGASRGVGRAIAAALAVGGWEVIGTCRDPGDLAEGDRVEGVTYLPLDLSSERSVDLLVRKVKAVDVLVNNAGESPIGPAEETPIGKMRELFQVNVFGPVKLTRDLLAPMRKKRRGTVIFIGSIRSELPTPFSSIYSASKAAIRSFAECARMEVAGYGVRIVVVAPWHVRTTLPQRAMLGKRSLYARAMKAVQEDRDRRIAKAPDPRLVAERVLRILAEPKPKAFSVVGKPFLTFLLRHAPRRLVEGIVVRMVGLHRAVNE